MYVMYLCFMIQYHIIYMPVHPNKPWRLRLDTGGDSLSSHLDEIVGNRLGTAKSQHMLETALAVDPCHKHPVFQGSEQPQKPPIFQVSHTLHFHITFIALMQRRNAVREGTIMQSTTQQIFSWIRLTHHEISQCIPLLLMPRSPEGRCWTTALMVMVLWEKSKRFL